MSHLVRVGAAAALAASGASASAATLVIDDSISGHEAAVTTGSGLPQSATSILPGTVSALGGERDLTATMTFGSNGQAVRAQVNPFGQRLLRQTIEAARGSTTVVWDGTDGSAAIAYGLLDFTVYGFINLHVGFSYIGGPVRFTIWDGADPTGATFAHGTPVVPQVDLGSNERLSLTVASLVPSAGASLAQILDSVGAIRMVVDATANAQTGWDSHYTRLEVSSTVPLPASGMMPVSALAAAAWVRRRTG